jgi:polygalacturonase
VFDLGLHYLLTQGVPILAPTHSPNTDGINPDSCSGVHIEDCYVVSGDDCVAIKSGWDEYGIKLNMPSQHIVVRRLTCVSPTSAAIALGSEMSGGIRDVCAEDIAAVDTESAMRIKTAVGRGAYVRDVFARRMMLTTMKRVFWMTGDYKSHPDDRRRLRPQRGAGGGEHQLPGRGGHRGVQGGGQAGRDRRRAVPGHLCRQGHAEPTKSKKYPWM